MQSKLSNEPLENASLGILEHLQACDVQYNSIMMQNLSMSSILTIWHPKPAHFGIYEENFLVMIFGLHSKTLALMNQLLCLHLPVNWLSNRVRLFPPTGVASACKGGWSYSSADQRRFSQALEEE